MGDSFRIDLARMRTVSRQLGECGERMGSVAERLESLGRGGQTGSSRLDSAVREFEEEWHDGIGRMARLATGLREGLDATLKAYGETEQAVAGGLAT
ncbi:WXG100 family type VII secretion target [Kitasatospora sp. NPDC054939]